MQSFGLTQLLANSKNATANHHRVTMITASSNRSKSNRYAASTAGTIKQNVSASSLKKPMGV